MRVVLITNKFKKMTTVVMKPFQCNQCNLSYYRNADLNRHIKIAHAKAHDKKSGVQYINQIHFQCSNCNLIFHNRCNLKYHYLLNHEKVPDNIDMLKKIPNFLDVVEKDTDLSLKCGKCN
jgi:uncharacterized Zn-finger protein